MSLNEDQNDILTPESGVRESDDRRRGARDSPSLMMLVLVATIGVLLYTTFLFDFSNRGNWIPYLMVLAAESVIILQALIALWTILSSGHNPRGYRFHNAQNRIYGPDHKTIEPGTDLSALPMYLHETPVELDVYITTYGEDLATVRRTVTAALAMHGKHNTYILDDGKSDEVRALAAELGAEYIVREGNKGAKAGNINNALTVTTGEYFVVLDADFVPKEDFLYQTVPFFAEANVAFVQTPQAYGNLHNLISRGAGYMQSVFYRFIQPGKNRFNAAFCVGTNVIYGGPRSSRSAASTRSPSPRTSGPRSSCTRAAGRRSTSPPCWPWVTPPRPSRPTPSSSSAGRPAVSRSCSRATRSPASAS